MTKTRRAMPVWAAGLVAMVVLGGALGATAGPARPVRLEATKILIEMNATAQDAGIQLFVDGEGWAQATLYGPGGVGRLLHIRASGSVGQVGLTELYFESEEPSLQEVPLEELFAMYPEGRYRIVGTTVEGRELVGSAVLSHDIPAGPSVIAPVEGVPVDPAAAAIEWAPVTEPTGIQIRGYQVIVELPEPARSFSVDLPATVTSVTVPAQFLQPGTEYKFEVLAVARNGNQTITEGTFSTAP